ncbi:hypothetical protein BD779DRAFT_1501845 [Infundibulicybe gibba]|nr:hypothetical protein BD779DRAFT_1501845 [Infundibulicybe gibba]
METTLTNIRPLADDLSHLLVTIGETDSDEQWSKVKTSAQALANGLRIRDGADDVHTALGESSLPETLTKLLSLSLHGSATPQGIFPSVTFEILRVAANLCMDHDGNRAQLLEAGLPQAVVSLLEGYAETVPPPPHLEPLALSIPHLQVIRTAIGVLLNACIGFDAIKFRLISLEVATTILKLSTAIYPPASWSNFTPNGGNPEANFEEIWALRSGLSNWAWRTISELKTERMNVTLQIFTPDILPLLTSPLLVYCSESPQPEPPSLAVVPNPASLLSSDFEVLEESCMLIESLSLDVEDVRLSLARGLHFPAEHSGVPCLSSILQFIEFGSYPVLWHILDESDRKRKEKAFDMCKAALIKSVVEVAGEAIDRPGGDFIYRMVQWIKQYVSLMDSPNSKNTIHREDMVICGSLSLGNLARRGCRKELSTLLSPPYSLAPILTSKHLLSPTVDIRVKHGIIGLLKHLAQVSSQSTLIHTSLGDAGVVQAICDSGIWDEKSDAMADVVQIGAIGVVKHMCNANVRHTLMLVLPREDNPAAPTGLSQILSLTKRSDSVALRSEGTRVLVNVIKSLWSHSVSNSAKPEEIVNTTAEAEDARKLAMRSVQNQDCALALASLVVRSGRFPLLVNEGVVALSLLSTQATGAPLVLDAILAPITTDLPSDPPPLELESPSSESQSPVATPATTPKSALDMLALILKNIDNPANFPLEVRMNVCSFLSQIGKHTSGEKLDRVQSTLRPVLEKLYEKSKSSQGKEDMLRKSMKRVLDGWRSA